MAPAGAADAWAHHPDAPEYAQHVYRVAGRRLCVGCFTTGPVFLAAVALLALARLPAGWAALALVGVGLASLQAISSAGLARRRWAKALVKAALGTGLALLVVGVREAPWPPLARCAALLAALGLALASGIPRGRRMAAASCACQAQSATSTP